MAHCRTPTPTVEWKCCKCSREVAVDPQKNECPECFHHRCDDCKPPTPPIAPVQDHYFNGQPQLHGHTHLEPQYGQSYYAAPRTHLHAYYTLSYGSGVPEIWTQQPSVAGWWECCVCKREVNPGFYSNTCPDDNHNKCGDCKNL